MQINPGLFLLAWFTFAVLGAIVGNVKMATAQGALHDPLGILVAFTVGWSADLR